MTSAVTSSARAYRDFTTAEKEVLAKLITTIATTKTIKLAFIEKDLEALGNQLKETHPLKFLAAILTDKDLRDHLKAIWDNIFKKDGFLRKGLKASLTTENEANNLSEHTEDFAKEVGKDTEVIKGHFKKKDWEEFVSYLLKTE